MDMLPMTKVDRIVGSQMHYIALVGLVIPGANVLAPLILWKMSAQRSGYLQVQGRDVVNFQLTLLIAGLIGAFIFHPLAWLCYVLMILGAIVGGVSVGKGESFRNRLGFPFISR